MGSGGGGWAGAREVEKRPAERERQRFSERPRELRQTPGENFCEPALGPGLGGGAGGACGGSGGPGSLWRSR